MIYEITTFKHYSIQYDEVDNSFMIDWNNLLSYGSMYDAKKQIDIYATLDATFKPFKATYKYSDKNDATSEINIIAIDNCGKLIYTDCYGSTNTISLDSRKRIYKYDVDFFTKKK